jgi:hypothetical protein
MELSPFSMEGAAMWGSDNWNEMVWGGAGLGVPMLEPMGLDILVLALLIGSALVVRRMHTRRLLVWLRGVLTARPLSVGRTEGSGPPKDVR